MGTSPALIQRWGHAALCVVYANQPERDICYNHGAAFTPSMALLGWGFLRGTARFKVILQPYADMLAMYRGEDRDIWVQLLPYNQAQVDRMVQRLESDLREENRYYTYHHMWNNCATRLRDHIDIVANGALRRGGDRLATPGGKTITFRDLARRGLAGRPLLSAATTLGFGRGLDKKVTEWASMGHPDYLRSVVAAKLDAPPLRAYTRGGPPLPPNPGYGTSQLPLLIFALFLAGALVTTRRLGRFERPATITVMTALTVIGLLLWFTALVTSMSELRYNEALLIFWPIDALLFKLKARPLQLYLRLRIASLVILSALLATGVLIQPLLTAILIPLLAFLALSQLPLWPTKSEEATEKPEAEPQAKAKGKSKARPQARSQARSQAKAQAKAKAKPKAKPKAKRRAKAKAKR